MPIQLFNFEWAVASDYVFEQAPSASGVLMGTGGVSQYIARQGALVSRYKPYETAPALHRDFVTNVKDAESALAFVKEYGFLGHIFGGMDAERESVEEILRHRCSLRSVLIWIDENPTYTDDSPAKKLTNKNAVHMGAEFKRLRHSLTRDNKLALGNLFNDLVTPHLTVRIDASNPKHEVLQVVPRSLISWMWLRVAEEITGDAEWRVCPICGTRFCVDRDARRRRREYCERPGCRKAAERQRKALERAAAEKQQNRKAGKQRERKS
jgi:hypothetical protein